MFIDAAMAVVRRATGARSNRLLQALGVVLLTVFSTGDARGAPYKQKPLSPGAYRIARQLVQGKGNLNILYYGNSRVTGGYLKWPHTRGFCFAGLQPHTQARGLLTGTGFINPAWAHANGGNALFSTVTTNGTPLTALGHDVQLNTPHKEGVRLAAGQHITTSGIVPAGPIRAKDAVTFTVNYRVGPAEGTFVITPLCGASASNMRPRGDLTRTVRARAAGTPRAAFTTITIPGVASGSVVRGLKITGSTGHSHIFTLHIKTTAATGFRVGRVAVAGQGYPNQMRTTKGPAPRCARADYIRHIASFDPDVVVLQYGANQAWQDVKAQGQTGVIEATRELLARIREARRNRPFLTILQLDHRSPCGGSVFFASWSRKDWLVVHALEDDVLLLDPEPRLPQDWPAQGSLQQSAYFRSDGIHETCLGSRIVWEAVFKDLQAVVAELPRPPRLDGGVPDRLVQAHPAADLSAATAEPGGNGCAVGYPFGCDGLFHVLIGPLIVAFAGRRWFFSRWTRNPRPRPGPDF